MTQMPPLRTPRAFHCRCGRPVFFRNSQCLACGTPLGYDPDRRLLMPLDPVDDAADTSIWQQADSPPGGPRYHRCTSLTTAAGCNWLVPVDGGSGVGQCRCCRLTRTLPDLSLAQNAVLWHTVALAQRRLVSALIGLGLPVEPKADDPQRGLTFDVLHALPGGPPVVTGHDDGVITIDVEEADDATREQRRNQLGEPYRTMLGHLRHECGHYYWQRLVDGTDWIGPYRALFGDEQMDYVQSLQQHYANGAPPDWGSRYVSAYASCHPWEDWAETWAHYLHMVDTLDTAHSFGLQGEHVELSYERYGPDVLSDAGDPAPETFVALVHGWMELTGVLNELSRSMGVADFYPFVLSVAALRKLHFVHRVVVAAASQAVAPVFAVVGQEVGREAGQEAGQPIAGV